MNLGQDMLWFHIKTCQKCVGFAWLQCEIGWNQYFTWSSGIQLNPNTNQNSTNIKASRLKSLKKIINPPCFAQLWMAPLFQIIQDGPNVKERFQKSCGLWKTRASLNSEEFSWNWCKYMLWTTLLKLQCYFQRLLKLLGKEIKLNYITIFYM